MYNNNGAFDALILLNLNYYLIKSISIYICIHNYVHPGDNMIFFGTFIEHPGSNGYRDAGFRGGR